MASIIGRSALEDGNGIPGATPANPPPMRPLPIRTTFGESFPPSEQRRNDRRYASTTPA